MTVIWRDSTDPTTYDVICCRGIFNQDRPSHRPIAVVKATSPRDVLDAVAISNEQRCQLAVRAGGHSIPVWSLCAESILVDLGGWKEINLQPQSGVVEVTPAVTSEELNQYLTVGFGRMFPGGHCPSVGIGGFVLSGGIGWNARNYGWACEYLSAVEVVTAQGALLLCNSQQNQELFWAARGAGPAFPGIVTKLYLKTLPFSPDGLRTSGYLYPKHLHRTLVEWLRFLVPRVSKNTEVIMIAQYSDNELCYLVKFIAMGSTLPEAEQSLRQIQETRPRGTFTEWNNQEETFDGLYETQAKANPSSHYYYTDDVFIDNNADVAAVLESAFRLPPGKSYAFWNPMYPCSRNELSGMALGIQSDHYISIYAISENRDEAESHKGWLQNTMAKIRPHAVGAYLGESDPGKLPGSWFWGEHNSRLFMDVRQRWDPDGVFAAAHIVGQVKR